MRTSPTPSAPRALITPAGYLRLQQELDHLWRMERPAITRSVSEAAAQGDRSENAEYIYGKKRLREIDRRVRFLRKRLEMLEVIRQLPEDQSRIYFGAWVEVESEDGRECLKFRIVGADEIDTELHHISINAPMARALLGRRAGDEVWVERPAGRTCFYVVDVNYELPAPM